MTGSSADSLARINGELKRRFKINDVGEVKISFALEVTCICKSQNSLFESLHMFLNVRSSRTFSVFS